MSTGAGVVTGQVFGLLLGVGVGLALAGASLFGIGMWLLPPRPKGSRPELHEE